MHVDALALSLARTFDERSASVAAVEHLEALGLRPSVYLERGGRLRCQALAGYRQLLDGIPPWVGVIGRTYATGESSVVADVRGDPAYLPAADGVIAEACYPVSCGGRTVGVVNVEASRPLEDGDTAEVARVAVALGRKLHALGGLLPESPSQRLVRHAIALATQYDTAAIERAVLAAAVDVTPLGSAMLLRRATPDGAFLPVRSHGPLGPGLRETPPAATAALAAFTTAGCSVYTVPDVAAGEGEGVGTSALRSAGANAMAVLPVGPDRILVVADRIPVGLRTEHCELLELLAAQASTCLRTAASVTELRTQAATDPLTGLGHHASFHTELAEMRGCGPLGVLVVDVDSFKAFNDRYGHPEGDRALRGTAAALGGALRRGDALFRIGGDEFAALLPGVDDAAALEVAKRLHAAVEASPWPLQVSIGAAAARGDEDEVSVLARADQALYAVKDAGRNGVGLGPGGSGG